MADAAEILTAFREDLIELELVRRPSEAGPRPPMHVEPVEGAPGPGEREGIEDDAGLVVSLFNGGELGEGTGYEAAIRRRQVVDVRYRGKDNAAVRRIFALDAAIRASLVTPARNYGYGFELGTAAPVFVHQAAVWGGLGPLGRGRDTGFDFVAKYLLEVNPG